MSACSIYAVGRRLVTLSPTCGLTTAVRAASSSRGACSSASTRFFSGDAINGEQQAKKKAAKAKRTEAYERKMKRLEALNTRRDGRPRDVKKESFRSWWNPRAVWMEKQDKAARRAGLPWRIRVSSVVERLPVVLPDKEQWERDYIDLYTYLSFFGREYPPETGFMREEDHDDKPDMTDEDLLALLPPGFVPAARETEADASGEVRTLDRRLKTRVYLAIQAEDDARGGVESRWMFPTTTAKEGETLLDAAKRAVSGAVGTDLELWCPSNCPMAVDLKVYSPQEEPNPGKGDFFGEKRFYFRVQRDDGDVSQEKMNVKDYAWLTREEMVMRVKDERGEHESKFYHYLL